MMNYPLDESIISSYRNRKAVESENKAMAKEDNKKRARYIQYQQKGGQLSIDNFENKEMRQYERDHRKNPKMYPNYRTWKQRKLEERHKKAEIEEKESKNSLRKAKAAHEKSIADRNNLRLERMKRENML